VITVTVNGEKRQLDGPTKLTAFLETLDINPRHVAVAHNETVLQRQKWSEVVLQDGDILEIVRMVGGGAQARTRKEPLSRYWSTAPWGRSGAYRRR
jgi:thiamine biosynthesis protein ThiS